MNKQFEKVSWIEGANVYEVNIRQYTADGTFSAFMKHLLRLKDMGVKILWLMPIYSYQ
jgi:1,4-alpha-glucan branching enzyme